jgi:hypothetical protein
MRLRHERCQMLLSLVAVIARKACWAERTHGMAVYHGNIHAPPPDSLSALGK